MILSTLRSSLTRHAKTVAGWLLFETRIYRLWRRNEAVIVLFHRVNDTYFDDPLTCTTRSFEAFTRFFGRFFQVVPLTTILDLLESGRRLNGRLAITFDDGYWGNATIAAPILERYGQRACFFVTTDWIGSDHVPWWDAEKKIPTRWMTWDQVRALHSAGHEIGSHTQTHPDLGVVSPEIARAEVGGGSARLDSELGTPSRLFAYPYGAEKNMSDANQQVVKELGLRCCLSAYGGSVRAGDDPLQLRRMTITAWFVSPYQFAFEYLIGSLDPD